MHAQVKKCRERWKKVSMLLFSCGIINGTSLPIVNILRRIPSQFPRRIDQNWFAGSFICSDDDNDNDNDDDDDDDGDVDKVNREYRLIKMQFSETELAITSHYHLKWSIKNATK